MHANTDSENVNNTFFDGQYQDIWRTIIPEELTKRELDFIFQYFKLQPNDRVLDIMCGYGRHSIGLARKGVQVVAVDNLKEYIAEIQQIALSENLSLQAVHSDVLNYCTSEKFNLAICMGNSLNFFNQTDTRKLISTIANTLIKGGYFLINTWSLAETVIKNFTEKAWDYSGDFKMLTDSEYLFSPTRVETEFIMINKKGDTERKKAVDYIYSYSEMQEMLEAAGFELTEVFSIPGKKKFSVGDPRAYIIAQKKAN
jgi:SAM-dependent methyltransferase